LIVYPTDTVYGLGCDPFNINAVKRLIRVKGTRNKPLPILSNSLSEIKKIVELSRKAKRIGEKFWPGPLTLVLRKKLLPNIVTSSLSTVGVRIPDHAVTLELIKLSGGFLVGTSANKTGAEPSSTVFEARNQLIDEVDAYLDGGAAGLGISSTVIDLVGKKPKILRRGFVSLEEILEELAERV
jgi:L-threonylcarbamoyladenylate synthase